MNLGQAITREYFASSIYRNILDMIATCETIRKDMRASMLKISRAGNAFCNYPAQPVCGDGIHCSTLESTLAADAIVGHDLIGDMLDGNGR